MKDSHENHLSMFRTFIVVCEKFLAIIMGIPALATAYALLKTLVTEFDDTAKQQGANIKGIAQDKRNLKAFMAKKSGVISAMLKAFANNTNNMELLKETFYTKSQIMKARDEVAREQCQLIYDKALLYQTDLADYGLTSIILSSLETAIMTYGSKSQQPTVAKAYRKQLTAKLVELKKRISDLLNGQIVPLLEQIEEDHPDAYKQLKNARQIIDLGVRHKKPDLPIEPDVTGKISGKIGDGHGKGLKGVTLILTSEEKTYMVITDKDGNFVFAGVLEGTYSLEVILYGKKLIKLEEVVVNDNDDLVKDFVMEDAENDTVNKPK